MFPRESICSTCESTRERVPKGEGKEGGGEEGTDLPRERQWLPRSIPKGKRLTLGLNGSGAPCKPGLALERWGTGHGLTCGWLTVSGWLWAWLKAYQSLIDWPTLISILKPEEVTQMLTD